MTELTPKPMELDPLKDLVNPGVNFVVGTENSGKTTLMQDLVVQLAPRFLNAETGKVDVYVFCPYVKTSLKWIDKGVDKTHVFCTLFIDFSSIPKKPCLVVLDGMHAHADVFDFLQHEIHIGMTLLITLTYLPELQFKNQFDRLFFFGPGTHREKMIVYREWMHRFSYGPTIKLINEVSMHEVIVLDLTKEDTDDRFLLKYKATQSDDKCIAGYSDDDEVPLTKSATKTYPQ